MTTRDEKNRRAYERFYRVEGSLAPRKRPTVAPVGVIELIGRRRQHVQDVKVLLERYEAALVDQETTQRTRLRAGRGQAQRVPRAGDPRRAVQRTEERDMIHFTKDEMADLSRAIDDLPWIEEEGHCLSFMDDRDAWLESLPHGAEERGADLSE